MSPAVAATASAIAASAVVSIHDLQHIQTDNSAPAEWKISALYTYPVKSCQPAALQESQVAATGLAYDRLWMLTDARSGRFVTQRQVSKLALVKVTINEADDTLGLSTEAMPTTLRLPLHPQLGRDLGEQFKVRVWYDDVFGRCCGKQANDWLTEFVGRPIRLLYKDPAAQRLVSRYLPAKEVCPEPPQSGFADVFPFHITTDVSLCDVNKHVPRPLEHRNFRPNIVLSAVDPDTLPYDEETWRRIEFSDDCGGRYWSMFVTSRTPRCTMPNVELETGAMSADREPMESLRKFRCVDPGKPTYVCFGMQAAPQRIGQTVRVGQSVFVRERGFHSLTESL
ncbi:hypothetical protein GGI25_000848 [Coemansia spiralis]|uniref:MOSC domain-containing protein n=2 Tax=Coemansia TaxID=4863 RepID=A0A9W8GDY0_9FUNG|nr:hypothetical protein BX070DRAFT_234028 [Coemansia spiralis]KAJ1994115.1 hypothetical protein EDC05_001785 [Coemansia umbellata]KAJ2623585.1 hypothetical protein GGI26_002223 [Coemansia sp. RSA 1358]KAJ2680255.1 hypothetical protein GGI25_000848 [Coemansia spiralis]